MLSLTGVGSLCPLPGFTTVGYVAAQQLFTQQLWGHGIEMEKENGEIGNGNEKEKYLLTDWYYILPGKWLCSWWCTHLHIFCLTASQLNSKPIDLLYNEQCHSVCKVSEKEEDSYASQWERRQKKMMKVGFFNILFLGFRVPGMFARHIHCKVFLNCSTNVTSKCNPLGHINFDSHCILNQ